MPVWASVPARRKLRLDLQNIGWQQPRRGIDLHRFLAAAALPGDLVAHLHIGRALRCRQHGLGADQQAQIGVTARREPLALGLALLQLLQNLETPVRFKRNAFAVEFRQIRRARKIAVSVSSSRASRLISWPCRVTRLSDRNSPRS